LHCKQKYDLPPIVNTGQRRWGIAEKFERDCINSAWWWPEIVADTCRSRNRIIILQLYILLWDRLKLTWVKCSIHNMTLKHNITIGGIIWPWSILKLRSLWGNFVQTFWGVENRRLLLCNAFRNDPSYVQLCSWRASQWNVSESHESSPPHFSSKSILILCSHLILDLPTV
jgi:hypothetical protein